MTVNPSGIRECLASVVAIPSRIVAKTATRSAMEPGPNQITAATHVRPTTASTIGYWLEIGRPQLRHFARSTNHDTTGKLSNHAIPAPQGGQRDRGRTTDCSAGPRAMHTLRNDPTLAPTKIPRVLAFRTENVREAHRDLKAKGLRFTTEEPTSIPAAGITGCIVAYDPNGNLIEMIELEPGLRHSKIKEVFTPDG